MTEKRPKRKFTDQFKQQMVQHVRNGRAVRIKPDPNFYLRPACVSGKDTIQCLKATPLRLRLNFVVIAISNGRGATFLKIPFF
ncbi:hypothetical protein [Sporomusa sp. KB1]|jgi:hypothetical protein|uniref:hypothetical protein n=1 Tax=Sporomusa sp. KB1 TaxID=943346 RepID=UPI0011AD317B|nr:hypothetical protein [Sporomusa sp. KB1]TWH46773.1 hypothetical protein Salpa_2788 [Sporomusa sp. KB1]